MTYALPQPTALQIASLRAEAGLPASGSATGGHMVQLLKHLSCCCVMVQPGHDSATVLNAAAGYARCITLVMQGGKHVESVILYGTVQVHTLEQAVEQLQICGIQVHLAAFGPGHSLTEAVSLSDDDEYLPAGSRPDNAPELARSEPVALPGPTAEPKDSLPATWPSVDYHDGNLNRTWPNSSMSGQGSDGDVPSADEDGLPIRICHHHLSDDPDVQIFNYSHLPSHLRPVHP